MNLSTTQLRMLGSVLYFAGVALIINFIAQFTITTWPFKFGELNWRVGSALTIDSSTSTVSRSRRRRVTFDETSWRAGRCWGRAAGA